MSFRSVGPHGMAAVTYRSKLRGANLLIFTRGGVRVSSMGSIEPTDFWSLYVVLNPWIEIPNATPVYISVDNLREILNIDG